jgi:hypothetical protein
MKNIFVVWNFIANEAECSKHILNYKMSNTISTDGTFIKSTNIYQEKLVLGTDHEKHIVLHKNITE